MRFDFYQLTRDPPEQLVPLIAAKIVAQGARVLVLSAQQDQLSVISEALWTQRPTSFLAHGISGEEGVDVALQPILLSNTADAANGADNLIIADGAWRETDGSFARIFYLFPPDRVEEARAAWRSLAGQEGADRHFWEQSGGGWIERGG